MKLCPLRWRAPEAWLHEIWQGISEQEIAIIQSSLNVVFPSEYRSFLGFFNGASLFFSGLELWGKKHERLPKKASPGFDLMEQNTHRHAKAGIPDSLLMIGNYNFGDFLCLSFNSNPEINATVVWWDYQERTRVREWATFTAWLDFEMIEARKNEYDYEGNELHDKG